MISSAEIVRKYIEFFKNRGHEQIANSPIVLQNDPTTLFTSSGMQPLVPYLLGEEHPQGDRLVNVQNAIRTQDIEEVGDNRHTTFFRMLGNWSLGAYFKKDQLHWFWEFLTKELKLSKEKLYVSVFEGNGEIPQDEESAAIWREILTKEGLNPEERISYYDVKKNWWSRSGTPEQMPAGEPGGPDSEVFYEFTQVDHDPKFGKICHPNCDCGRFMEIGNSVFMQYIKQEDGTFKELPKKNVDFGGGLERLAAAINNNPDIFTTDLYNPIIATIEKISGKLYAEEKNKIAMRVIADHLKAATFLIVDNVRPSNKEHGYILRRLLRRAAVKMHFLGGGLTPGSFSTIADEVLLIEEIIDSHKIDRHALRNEVMNVIDEEMDRFAKTLDKGLREVEKNIDRLDDISFDLYQSYGFPFEILEELAKQRRVTLNRDKFQERLRHHQDQSRTASAGKFRGGLADQQKRTIMGHTATHLMHKALRDVLGNHVHQTGSNITTERIRFDFNYDQKLTDEQIKQVEDMVNEKIKENLPVHFEMIPTEEAQKMGAIGLFMDTYGNTSKIYFIGDTTRSYKDAYSIEFCGGPHVEHTNVLKNFKIFKQENLGKNQKRLYAIVDV